MLGQSLVNLGLRACDRYVLDVFYRDSGLGEELFPVGISEEYVAAALPHCRDSNSVAKLEKYGLIFEKEGELFISPLGKNIHEFILSPKTVQDAEKILIATLKQYGELTGKYNTEGPDMTWLRERFFAMGYDGKLKAAINLAMNDKKIQKLRITDEEENLLSIQYILRPPGDKRDTVTLPKLGTNRQNNSQSMYV